MIKDKDLESIIKLAESVQITNNGTHEDLLDIYEGNLKSHVEDSMRIEFNDNAFEVAKQRIAPINILKRTTDKLAKVYSQGVERSTNVTDTPLIDQYESILDLDNQMSKSDSMINLLRSVAFEPYIRDGVPSLRVLTPNEFTVWSDDTHDKTKPTVFIKFMGVKETLETIDDSTTVKRVNLYVLYDKDEFIKIDSELQITERAKHNVGRIPFTYMNLSISKLIPSPDNDSLCMSILIPKLLSDLNYASKYLSHGIRYGIDIDVANLEGNPDAFWQISSQDKEGAKPEIGVISPSVDVDKIITLIREELTMYLESRSLKVGASGKFDSNTSGIAKLIDNADVTDVRKENMHVFKAVEQDLWALIAVLHNTWQDQELLEGDLNKRFSTGFEISIKYGDLAPIVDPREKRDNLKFKMDNGLITRDRAIRQANPELTKTEQDILIKELEVEKADTPNKVDIGPGSKVQGEDSEGSDS